MNRRRTNRALSRFLAFAVPWVAPAARVNGEAETPVVRATEPPSLRVEVASGSRIQVLEFDPPAAGRATSTGPVPGDYHPGQPEAEQMRGWNAFCPLPPENPKILGYFRRGIPAESLVLKNHDGTKTFVRGEDYHFSTEFAQVLGLKGRLGRRAADMKNPKPEEQLRAEFAYYQQRLDLVQVDQTGRASVKKGPSAIMCPVLPEPDAGCVGVAGVWVYGANGKGPVPTKPEGVAIMPADIASIKPLPPVAPVNPHALAGAVAKLRAGKPIGIGFFGDSISVGAEAPDWYSDIYSPRNRGFVGMVIRDLRARYPRADVQPAWGIAGAQSIFNEGLWTNVIQRAPAATGPEVWWEAEAGGAASLPRPTAQATAPQQDGAASEFAIANDDERRVLSDGQWLPLSPGDGADYTVTVPDGGPLRFFIRQANRRGPIRWRWDSGPWQTMPDPEKFTDADDVRRGLALCWFDLGAAELKPGRHTLRVEAVDKPAAVDCFALSTDSRGPWRKYRAGELTVDVVVYAMGMNGGFNEKTPRKRHKETILRHIREARERGAEVLLVATMENNCRLLGDPDNGKKPNRDLLAEIAGETGCAFADVYTEWMNQESRGVPPESRLHNFINHPDAVGHRLWADVILRCFDAAGDKPHKDRSIEQP